MTDYDITKLNKASFAEGFLKEYLKDGFMSLSKRDVDLLVLRLLLEHTEGWTLANPPSPFEIAKALKAKNSRIRNAIDDIKFRHQVTDEEAKRALREILTNAERDYRNNKVHIQIDDGFLREYATELIRRDFGIVDTSFSRTVLVVSGQKFLVLAAAVLSAEEKKKFAEAIKKESKGKTSLSDESLIKEFIKGVVRGSGQELGKYAVSVADVFLAGGVGTASKLLSGAADFAQKLSKNVGAIIQEIPDFPKLFSSK